MMNFKSELNDAANSGTPSSVLRRDFLSGTLGRWTARLATGAPQLLAGPSQSGSLGEIEHPRPTADACILLWMGGGMAAPDTFDPKGYLPFEKGLAVKDMLSTFPAIDTSVDGLQICKGLENIASIMDRATLIRSHVQPEPRQHLHSRHQYHWHTGYVPPQTVAAPHIGAWMSRRSRCSQ